MVVEEDRGRFGVSLVLDPTLETADFTHYMPGQTFKANSILGDFKLKYDINDVQVRGLGTAQDSDAQMKAWKWEVERSC